MAQVTGTLPAPSNVSSVTVQFGTNFSSSNLAEDVSILRDGAGTAFLRFVSMTNVGASVRTAALRVSEDSDGFPGTAGPDLSSAWEGSATALTLRAPTLPDLVVIGPGSAGLESTDTTEPYQWRLSTTQDAAAYSGTTAMGQPLRTGIGGWISGLQRPHDRSAGHGRVCPRRRRGRQPGRRPRRPTSRGLFLRTHGVRSALRQPRRPDGGRLVCRAHRTARPA